MRTPRGWIVPDNHVTHLTWRCHNRSNYLILDEVKDKLLELYFEYKYKYQIKIYAFDIMDDHAHFIVGVSTAKNLGDYMRCVNSQLAVFINKKYKKDSQAIKDRYKSPVIENTVYLCSALAYVLLNRFKVNFRLHPKDNPYNSYYHLVRKTKYGQQLDSISELGLCEKGNEVKFLTKLIEGYIKKLLKNTKYFVKYCFQHPLAIGSINFVNQSIEYVRKKWREKMENLKPKPDTT